MSAVAVTGRAEARATVVKAVLSQSREDRILIDWFTVIPSELIILIHN
jgi:hypothetical protein